MTIDELEWYVMLAETEHMTEAAARLNITQPTLSRSLARLEHRLGTPLFDRVNRRLRLNRYGEILLEYARRCVSELNAASDHITSLIDPDRGTVRLAFLHSVAIWLVPELLRRYRTEVPGVRFELRQAPGHEILADLSSGKVDLAVTSPRPDTADTDWSPLLREQLCLAVPMGHRLDAHERAALTEVRDEPFVALRRGFGMRELSDELCAAAGFTPEITFESTEIPSMEGLVAAGLGVAITPRPRAHRKTPEVRYLHLTDDRAYRDIGLVAVRGRPLPPVTARFARFVTEQSWG